MKTINTEELWDDIIDETHRGKPNKDNRAKRELLFVSQILLSRYELAKKENNKPLQDFCADILKTYEEHNINRHIKWNK